MSDLQQVIDKAQADPKYRARLKTAPAAVLAEAGVPVPAGLTVEVIETQPHELHLFLGTRGRTPEMNQILQRAEKDAAFKQKLVSSPRPTIEEATGEKLPAEVKVCVHESVDNRFRLVLPTDVNAEGELSDLELEAVAGGGFFKRVLIGIVDAICPNDTVDYVKSGVTTHDYSWSSTVEATK